MLSIWLLLHNSSEKATGSASATKKAPGSPNAACTIAETVVYLRYKLNGQHYERWVELWEAKYVRRDLENQGAVIYWSERK